jgi:hypothetical protein
MRRVWFLVLLPIWNFSAGCVEACLHWDDRDEGYQRIAEVRAEIEETCAWPVIEWWTDKGDTIGFESYPWVTAARGYGDCEDAMALAEEILEGYVTCRAYIKHPGGWHAVLLWQTSDGWSVITNMVHMPRYYETAREAAFSLYGDATEDIILH